MIGYDYEIICKKGKDNVTVSSLSNKYDEGSLIVLTLLVLDCLEKDQQEWLDIETVV